MDQSKSTLNRDTDVLKQRSFNNFKIGDHRILMNKLGACACKKACALTNAKCGAITEEKAKLITLSSE